MKFIAGIDGGGTKTRVACCDHDGNEIARKTFGAFNLNSIGIEKFTALLADITEFLNSVGKCEAICIGSAGVSNELMVSAVSAAMENAGIENWQLVGDNVIALWGALNGAAGIAFIAGTGSICFGRGENGEEARSGGWGHLIGDEGSGYALGRDALVAIAQEWDGYGEKTMLTKLIAEELGLDTQRKLISYAYGGDKSVIAALAGLVSKAALAGDRAANRIIADNAEKMCANVGAVARKLALPETKVAMLGGLLENDTPLKSAFVAAMARNYPDIICIDPQKDACAGAVMMAQKMLEKNK